MSKKGDKEFVVDNDESFVIMSYYDTKKCNFISTFGSTEPDSKARKNGSTPPNIVQLYNAYMHGVDKFDGAVNLYRFEHRQRKYTNAIFYTALLKTAAVQSWKIDRLCWMKKTNGGIGKNYLMQRKFLLAASLQLLDSTPVYRISRNHFPSDNEKEKKCSICKSKNTHMFCKACVKHICISCFEKYHEKLPVFRVPALTINVSSTQSVSKH